MYNKIMTNNKRRKILEYNAVFQQENDGGYSAWVPSLPGCTSQGDTFELATENIKEAIGLYLDEDKAIEKFPSEAGIRQFLVPITYQYA